MKRQIAVIGLGRFGESLATNLTVAGHDVLAIDRVEAKVQNISPQVTHAVQADATNETVINELGITNFDIVIVAIGSPIESSVLSTILLKKLGVPFIIARANDALHGEILARIGADNVIYPERDMGWRVAYRVTLLDVTDYMMVAPGYGIAKFKTPVQLVGKGVSEVGFGYTAKKEVALLLIQRGKEVIVSPSQQEKIKEEDLLVVAGSDDKLENLLNEFREKKNGE